MKRHALTVGLAALVVGALALSAMGAAARKGDKIPLTTKSEKARQYYLRGQDLVDRLLGQESVEYFEKAIAEDPDFAMAYLSLAQVSPNTQGFLDNLGRALALVDKVSEGERLCILGVEAGATGFPLKQRDYYKKLVEAYPNDERAHNLLGTNYFALQDYFLAIEEYRKATEIEPKFSPPYNQLGYCRRFLGDYAGAEKAFKQYIKLIPDDPNPYDSYAELLLKMGKFDESIEYYRKALAVDSNFVASYVGIATDLNLKGQHEAARKQLDVLYARARTDGERRAVHFAKAVSYADDGDLVAAVAEIEQQYALAEATNDIAGMSGDLGIMGNILSESGKYDEAKSKYEQAVGLIMKSDLPQEIKDNTELNSLYFFATVAIKQGNVGEAREKAKQYLKGAQANDNPAQIRLAHQLAGMIALEEESYDRALKELAQASQQDPYNLYRTALAYKGAGNIAKAREYCKQAANFNAVNNLNQAFMRDKARQLLASL